MTIKQSILGTIAAILAIFSISCNNTGEYTITGKAPILLSDNDIIYLKNYDTNLTLDSTSVSNGEFEFIGTTEGTTLCALESGALQSTFILEKGKINIDISEPFGATGTKLNEELNNYLTQITELSKQTEKKLTEISEDSSLSEDTADLQFFTTQESFLLDIEKINSEYFTKNNNNALGLFVLTLWLDFLTVDKFIELYNSSGEYIQNNQSVKEILEAVQNVDLDHMH